MTPQIGHNRGPSLDEGVAWRRHCWTEARRALLPTLPLEVVRLRVKRAREVGLDYRTYATLRATSGHDIVAFLFSSNALRMFAPDPRLLPDRGDKLAALVGCGRVAAVLRPLEPAPVMQVAAGVLTAAYCAPPAAASWHTTRGTLREILSDRGLQRDGVVVVGDTDAERAWVDAAALAGYLPALRFFGASERRAPDALAPGAALR